VHSNVTSKNVSGFTLAGPPCIHTTLYKIEDLGGRRALLELGHFCWKQRNMI